MIPSFDTAEKTADTVVVGRYLRDSARPDRGRIVVFESKKGAKIAVLEVVWSLSVFEDSSLDDCAVTIPSDGHFGKYWLAQRDDGLFVMIARASSDDPFEDEPDYED